MGAAQRSASMMGATDVRGGPFSVSLQTLKHRDSRALVVVI